MSASEVNSQFLQVESTSVVIIAFFIVLLKIVQIIEDFFKRATYKDNINIAAGILIELIRKSHPGFANTKCEQQQQQQQQEEEEKTHPFFGEDYAKCETFSTSLSDSDSDSCFNRWKRREEEEEHEYESTRNIQKEKNKK